MYSPFKCESIKVYILQGGLSQSNMSAGSLSLTASSLNLNSAASSELISPESELIAKLEVSGMASVAAARALETAGSQGITNR